MMYTKTNPQISYTDFLQQAQAVKQFKSLTGREYQVRSITNDQMSFLRVSTGEHWSMDLREVQRAYQELTDFKTINFKPYVPRTHSPALGLLLHLGLLTKA